MKTAFSLAVLAVLLVVPGRCFALWVTASVSKERAKELGIEVRSEEAGPNQVRVELEFKTEGKFEKFSPEGKFQGYCGVELRIGEGTNPLVTAPLREDRSKPGPMPGRVVFSFAADRAQLETVRLCVFAPESDGGTIYVLAVKDFVEPEKDPKGTTDLEFEFHRGKVPATELKVQLVAGKDVVKEKRGLILPLTITNASGEAIKTKLAHEWHGGEWPSTSLFASVTPIADKEPKPFAPVYLAGEDQEAARAVSLAPGKSSDIELRVDWPGTGSVKGDPLIQKPGKYIVRFALVFQAGGKQQHAASAPIEVEYKSE